MRTFVMDTTRRFEMPPEPDPTARQIYNKVFTQPDVHEWLDVVEPSDVLISALDDLPPTSKLWDVMTS